MKDAPGSADSPLLSRFQGSILHAYGDHSFGSAQFVETDKGKPVLRVAEGKISNRFYWSAPDASVLEIHRNYLQALKTAGYTFDYICEIQKCRDDRAQRLVQKLPRDAEWQGKEIFARDIFNSGNQDGFTLISARKPAGTDLVRVLVATSMSDLSKPYNGRVRQLVQIIEPAAIQTGLATVDVDAIGDTLKRGGKIALYGVLFDTTKAVVRPDSDAQLAQMAKALAATPAMKVFIVGHTDNQGDFEANMGLSQRRAQAVVDALASRFGVAANRMTARGVASLAPVASNQNEDSRARNRRVELVLR